MIHFDISSDVPEGHALHVTTSLPGLVSLSRPYLTLRTMNISTKSETLPEHAQPSPTQPSVEGQNLATRRASGL